MNILLISYMIYKDVFVLDLWLRRGILKYKLIGEYEDAQHPVNQILINRGIKDVSKWAAANEENINSP